MCTFLESYIYHIIIGFFPTYYIIYVLIYDKYLLTENDKMMLSKLQIFMKKYVWSFVGTIILGLIFAFVLIWFQGNFCETT